MKRLLIVVMNIVFCSVVFGMDVPLQMNEKQPAFACEMKGEIEAMRCLLALGARGARGIEGEAKEKLQAKMRECFSLDKAIARVQSLDNPQVALWFANYFGGLPKETLRWYKKEIFSTIPNATFWLTDLKAWGFLVVDPEALESVYPDLVAKLKATGRLEESECPMLMQTSSAVKAEAPLPKSKCLRLTQSSNVFEYEFEKGVQKAPKYRLLASNSFFKWLQTVDDEMILPVEVCNALRKTKRPETVKRFPVSLRSLGFQAKILDKILPACIDPDKPEMSKPEINMLDAEFYLIYPILQYLEGIYYAACLVESKLPIQAGQETSIVFLLPNKEFAYYTIPGEATPFMYFIDGIKRVITQFKDQIQGAISIRIEPFAYGDDLKDAPYRAMGQRFNTKKAFLSELKK